MALNRQDCAELTREIEEMLREYDPGSYELISRGVQSVDDPRRYLVVLMETIRSFYSERSRGRLGEILNGINHFVRLPDESPVRGISVELSPREREEYHTDEVNLAELPDRSTFLAELERVTREIDRELGLAENEV